MRPGPDTCGIRQSEGQRQPEPIRGEPWKLSQVLEVMEAKHEEQKMNSDPASLVSEVNVSGALK